MATWDETSPAGSDLISEGDDEIRQLKTDIRERMDNEHVWTATGDNTEGTHRIRFRGVSLRNSANQSIPTGTTTPITWNTEDFDTEGMHSTVSNTERITIPSGVDKVRASVTISFDANANGYRTIQLSHYDDSTGYSGIGTTQIQLPATAYDMTIQITTNVVAVDSGDYFYVTVYQNSGSSLNVQQSTAGFYSNLQLEVIEFE